MGLQIRRDSRYTDLPRGKTLRRTTTDRDGKGTIHNPQWYNCWRAQNLYIRRRRGRVGTAISAGSAWNYVREKLAEYWSPETICGRWKLEHPEAKPLHYSTIYRYITRKYFPKISRETHLRRRGKRIQTRNANYNTIQPDRIIPEWPEEIRLRKRIGDWEGDTVYGGVGKGLLVTLFDRKSRFLCAGERHPQSASLTAPSYNVDAVKGSRKTAKNQMLFHQPDEIISGADRGRSKAP